MSKQIPLRKCVVTREQLPKQELLRIVKSKDGTVEIDFTGKINGRGAYLKRTLETVTKAQKSRAIERSLKVELTEDFYEALRACIDAE